MRCSQVKKRLNSYVDQQLPDALRVAVNAHLAECERCSQALAAVQSVLRWLDGPSPVPAVPDGFAERLMAQARLQSGVSPAERPRAAILPWLRGPAIMRLAAAAMIVLGLGLGAWMGSDLSRQAPRAAPAQADPLVAYNLDYFADAPADSLVGAYLALSSGVNGNGG